GVDGAALDAALRDAFVDRDGRQKARTRAVVVAHKGRLIAERYAPGYDARSVLPGWSMSKSLVNALIGLRIGDGELALDRELPVPEWSAENDPRRQLRLMDLLRMESGLDWSEDYEAAGSLALRMLFLESDYASLAASQPLVRAPREEHRYSSGTTNLLCRILRTTFPDERSYLAYARDRLFLPLGMTSALLEPDPSGVFVGSSFGFATARDWARFGQFYLQDGVVDGKRLLPEGWVDLARTPCAVSPRGDYGAHLWLNAGTEQAPERRPFNRLPRDVFYLSGYEGQYVVCMPSAQLVIVRLGCTKRGGFDLHGFLQRVLRACSGADEGDAAK
ncbi:MAG: serine hydrolase, partial [Planctomycetota bacterium]